jgi:uncharacterized protein
MLLAAAFLIGLVSSVFTSFAGGALGVVAVPLLLLMGLSPYSAVSTPKVAAVGVAIGSLFKFHGKKQIRWEFVSGLVILAAFAGIIGAYALLQTPEYIVENIVVFLLIVSVVGMWADTDMGVVAFTTSRIRKLTGYVAYFVSELFRAAFGSGFGMITGAVLVYFFGLTQLESMATKRIPGLVVSVVALLVFLANGVIDLPVGVSMFFGSIAGSYIGTHYALKVGNKWLKYVFTGFALGMAVVLLLL